MAPTESHAQAWAVAVQVAAANAMRGMLFHEMQDDPSVGSVVMECGVDGSVSVTLCSTDGHPVGGFTL